GGSASSVVDFKLADEPAWYYPYELQQMDNDPAWLADFRSYLAAPNSLDNKPAFQPSDFGQASWNTGFPLGAADAAQGFQPTDLPSRELFYWTMRYFTDLAAQSMLADRMALQAVFPNLQTVDTNLNGTPGTWYTASPNAPIGNNPANSNPG